MNTKTLKRQTETLTTRVEQGWYGGIWVVFDANDRAVFMRKLDTDTARQLGIELMRQADLADEKKEHTQ